MVYSLLNSLETVPKEHGFDRAIVLPIIDLGDNCRKYVTAACGGGSERRDIGLRRAEALRAPTYLVTGSMHIRSDDRYSDREPRRAIESMQLRRESRVRIL
jgi:hypothetical protein